jgi:hypothetical protein
VIIQMFKPDLPRSAGGVLEVRKFHPAITVVTQIDELFGHGAYFRFRDRILNLTLIDVYKPIRN